MQRESLGAQSRRHFNSSKSIQIARLQAAAVEALERRWLLNGGADDPEVEPPAAGSPPALNVHPVPDDPTVMSDGGASSTPAVRLVQGPQPATAAVTAGAGATPLSTTPGQHTLTLISSHCPSCGTLNGIVNTFLSFLDTEEKKQLPEFGWAWVNPASDSTKFRSAIGKAADGTRVSFQDLALSHDSMDYHVPIELDPIAANDGLLTNENDGELGVEWETKDLPMWVWPTPGDRVWVNGNHVYDCGHAGEKGEGTDVGGFKSEIHPPRAMAAMRSKFEPMPGTGNTRVAIVETDLYINGNGGFAPNVLHDVHVIINGKVGKNRTTPIHDSYSFDINLPARPKDPMAQLAVTIADGQDNTVDAARYTPQWVLDPATNVLHVTIPLNKKTSGGNYLADTEKYGRVIKAGWVYPTKDLVQVTIQPDHMILNDDHDHGLYGANRAGELMMWMDVPGSEFDQKLNIDFLGTKVSRIVSTGPWYDLRDWDVATADGSKAKNTLDHYDDSQGDGNGRLNFSKQLLPTVYVVDGKSFKFRITSWERDSFWWGLGAGHSAFNGAQAFSPAELPGEEDGTFENDDMDWLSKAILPKDGSFNYSTKDYKMYFNVESTPVSNVVDLRASQSIHLAAVGASTRAVMTIDNSMFKQTVRVPFGTGTISVDGGGLPKNVQIDGSIKESTADIVLSNASWVLVTGDTRSAPQPLTLNGNTFTLSVGTIPVNGKIEISYDLVGNKRGAFTSVLNVSSDTLEFEPRSNHSTRRFSFLAGLPGTPDLTSDTGRSSTDNITSDGNPQFNMTGVPAGALVELLRDGIVVASRIGNGALSDGAIASPDVAEGTHNYTSRLKPGGLPGEQSDPLAVVLDYTAPAVSVPDLSTVSDNAGVIIDNITSDPRPIFEGTAEPGSEVRLYRQSINKPLSDPIIADATGAWSVQANQNLTDGNYVVTAIAKDAAGNFSDNFSDFSPSLQFTIATKTLTLAAPSSNVVINLDEGTITGFPGISGGVIGIKDIPLINVNVGAMALLVKGGKNADRFLYTANAAGGVTLTRENFDQTLKLLDSSSPVNLTIDPADGNDVVVFTGTSGADTYTVTTAAGGSRALVQHNTDAPIALVLPNTESIQIDAGSGNDTVTMPSDLELGAVLNGGTGNDILRAGSGANTLDGGDGDDILAGGSGTDLMIGGPGNDTADYSSRTGNLTIGLGVFPDDGEANEHDNVRSDIETVLCGSGNDSVRGTDGDNLISGGGGNDALEGLGGNDRILGGEGSDILIGDDGKDSLLGQLGRDILVGGRGSDSLDGGEWDDILIAGSGPNAAALVPIQKEWLSTSVYSLRIAHLTGATVGGLNGTSFLKNAYPGRTVFDDSSIDVLTGGSGTDWFILNRTTLGAVDLSDQDTGEIGTDL